MRPLSSPFVACFLVLSLVGCAETTSCPEGTARRLDANGRPVGECIAVTIDDGGQDAQVVDSGPPDAGPCGACDGGVCDVDSGACVQCVANTDCDTTLPVCDTDTHTCVGCVMDSDCGTAAAARCDAGSCVACNDSAQCVGIDGTEVCAASGECVECTVLDASACSGNPCTADNTCSAYGTGLAVCEACDTDANCQPNFFCVPMEYMGASRPGGYCLQDAAMGPACVPPFLVGVARTSLSGHSATYCGIFETLATCEATRALLDQDRCPTGADSECPQPSGICRTLGIAANRCTYPCGGSDQCLDPSLLLPTGVSCGDGTTSGPMFCGG